jgi:hypothetical protein
MAELIQPPDDRTAYESGAAGYDDSHVFFCRGFARMPRISVQYS